MVLLQTIEISNQNSLYLKNNQTEGIRLIINKLINFVKSYKMIFLIIKCLAFQKWQRLLEKYNQVYRSV